MSPQVLIAGGGIGGLAAALACARAGCEVRLYEREPVFGEVGAGLQLGPNAVRVLQGWGLGDALARVGARPEMLTARSALTGERLAGLPLGDGFQQRYGAPYVTVHRADLHALLLQAVRQQPGVRLNLNAAVAAVSTSATGVQLRTTDDLQVEGDALVGADGLWSRVRGEWFADGEARSTGHVAYRALVPQAGLPEALRSQEVTAWLGPGLHAVSYPVCGGEALNLVVIAQGRVAGDPRDWDHHAVAGDLQALLTPACAPLRDLAQAAPHWRLWMLNDRPPVSGPGEMARGRVALLGDAAHPMRPYLAQGAGMALEDAAELGRELAMTDTGVLDVPAALHRYALNRWQRVARVQARSRRNGQVFHATGPLRMARDLALRWRGEQLMDLPWLYGRSEMLRF
ncbi:MAG: FAD-dependent monooxygenase [Ramlibacter sp.]|nr:FAD-dependent monooxygenase [Ramlibacter sp.]